MSVPSEKPGPETGAEEDFAALFEQSLKSPQAGRSRLGPGRSGRTRQRHRRHRIQVRGHRSRSTSSRTRDGELHGAGGRRVDVYFESTDTETRQRPALAPEGGAVRRVARHRAGLRGRGRRRGLDRRQGEGRPQGRHRRPRVPAGLARRHPAGPQPRSLHRPARPLRDPEVQPLARQRRGLAPRRPRARARRSSRKRRSRCSRRASSSRAP